MEILQLDMYVFFVFVEEVLDPSIKRKHVVGGSIEGRGVVSAPSYVAMKYLFI